MTTEAAWQADAARSIPSPFWPLTWAERRLTGFLCGAGLDGWSAWLVALDYRCNERRSAWFYLVEPHVEQLQQEWISYNRRHGPKPPGWWEPW